MNSTFLKGTKINLMNNPKAFLFNLLFLVFVGASSTVLAQTVYITKTGEKYHKITCRYLSKSCYSIELSDAKDKGYASCKVCKPGSGSSAQKKINPGQAPKIKSGTSTLGKASSSSSQCISLTKTGKRCSRMTKDKSGKCWQHME